MTVHAVLAEEEEEEEEEEEKKGIFLHTCPCSCPSADLRHIKHRQQRPASCCMGPVLQSTCTHMQHCSNTEAQQRSRCRMILLHSCIHHCTPSHSPVSLQHLPNCLDLCLPARLTSHSVCLSHICGATLVSPALLSQLVQQPLLGVFEDTLKWFSIIY